MLAVAHPTPPSAPPSRPLIAVVDDDPAVLGALRFALEVEGFAVSTFRSGEELAARIPEAAACYVVDYRLPGRDGIEVVAGLRQQGFAAPAVLITTGPGPALRRRAAEAGLAIVEKPLLGNALADAIRRAIEG